jgi:hypothetical protein
VEFTTARDRIDAAAALHNWEIAPINASVQQYSKDHVVVDVSYGKSGSVSTASRTEVAAPVIRLGQRDGAKADQVVQWLTAGSSATAATRPEEWPNVTVRYDYPARTATNDQRWQDAIAAALKSASLQLLPRTAKGDVFDLTGSCPRCGHSMSQTIEFDVIVGVTPVKGRFGIFNVSCNCTENHGGRDANHLGCGWGGSIPVAFTAK